MAGPRYGQLAETEMFMCALQAALGREEAAVESMQQALTLLTEHWPSPAQQTPAQADTKQQKDQQQQQEAQQQLLQKQSGTATPVTGGSKEAAAAAAAAVVARREQARRAKVERLRGEAVCTTLGELAGVLRQLGRAAEAKAVQQRLQEMGCEGAS
jgi:hypothetical protein